MTRLGRRVALVDANLQAPMLDHIYAVESDEGLTDVLLDSEPLPLLHPVDAPPMDLLVSGPRPPAPEELLASPRFPAMLEELASSHDLVVLDGPPLDAGADALLMAAAVDVLLPLIPLDVPVADLGRELNALGELGVPILGVVSTPGGG
jgi:Mrp family chromosome partitioning ATPase